MKPLASALRGVTIALACALLGACAKSPPPSPAAWKLRPSFSEQPGADTILSVSGLVNGGKPAYFSMEELKALPKTEFSSSDPWSPGRPRYGGFQLYPFLEALNLAPGARFALLRAVNDYSIKIALESLRSQRYLVSYEEDGKPYADFPDELNKGPLAIAIPHEELKGVDMEVLKLSYVWWLNEIRITE